MIILVNVISIKYLYMLYVCIKNTLFIKSLSSNICGQVIHVSTGTKCVYSYYESARQKVDHLACNKLGTNAN